MNMYEEFLLKTKKELIGIALQLLNKPMPEITEELFALFETTGNRVKYEAVYFGRRKFLTVFGCLALWMKEDGEELFAPLEKAVVYGKLEEILREIYGEECWALPAHVNRKTDANWRNTVDLFASETAGALVELACKLETELSPMCTGMCKVEALKRVVEPFFAVEPPFAHWERCEHNWNAVCVGNIGSAAIYLYQNQPNLLKEYISRVCDDLTYYVEGFAEDGTCMEGLGYYAYGMGYFVNFANQIYEYSKGAIDLLKGSWGKFCTGEEDKRSRMAQWWSKCYFASGRSVSFSDGSSRDKYRMGLGCSLKHRFEQVQIPDVSLASSLEEDHCYRFVPMRMDIFETKKLVESMGAEGAYRPHSYVILPSAQWCLGNSENGCFMAIKGGHNDEPHNHNDVGSFLYGIGKELFLTDLGAGEYVKEYFSDGRYGIFCNRSLGHNVPLICGLEQKNGKEYAATGFTAVEEELVGECSMELVGAYDTCVVKRFSRKAIFDKRNGELTICDAFEASVESAVVMENFVTQIEPVIKDGKVYLKGEENTCVLMVDGPISTLHVSREMHSNHQGQPEDVYRIFFDIKIADSESVTIRIANLKL